MDFDTLRRLVELDPEDPLSRFALGEKLVSEADDAGALAEAEVHLRFSNSAAPDHLATYHVLAQLLLRLSREEEARPVLEEGIRRAMRAPSGQGGDLVPILQDLLDDL